MKLKIATVSVAASAFVLTGIFLPYATSIAATTPPAAKTVSDSAIAPIAGFASTVVPTPIAVQPAPARAPAHDAPTVPVTATGAASLPTSAPAPITAASARVAYVNAMYLSVVPAGQRAALAGHYVLGYNLPGLGCGTGCTGLFDGQARSSFDNTFFAESLAYQQNTVAHEAAHAYGFLSISSYATPSWATASGWQIQFHSLDRSFVRTYDAEAWAACVAWKESGFNNRVDQVTAVCTPQAAIAAMAQIP